MLDLDLQRFVEETERFYTEPAAKQGDEPEENVGAAAMRRRYDAMAAHFREPRPEGVRVRDEALPGPAGRVPVRRYDPPRPAADGATVVYFHGGGFVLGGLDSHDDVCAEIAAGAGAPVVSVDYRLAPEHRHPAAVDDAVAAADHLAARGPILLAGDSVGGNLAAAAALALRGGTADRAGRLRGHVLIYPSLGGRILGLSAYAEEARAPLLSDDELKLFEAMRADGAVPAQDPRFWPLAAGDFSGLCPCRSFSVAHDPLRDDGGAWAARLQAAGVDAVDWVAEGLMHGCLRARSRSRRAAAFFERIVEGVAELAR